MKCCLMTCVAVVLLPHLVFAQEDNHLSEYRSGLPASEENATHLGKFLEVGLDRRRYRDDSSVNTAMRNVPFKLRSDPAFKHAHAIVLLSRRKTEEAVQLLESNRGSAPNPFIPSWKVLILHHLKRREYDPGYELINEFVELQEQLAKNPPADTNSINTIAQIEWVGIVYGALDRQFTNNTSNRDQLQKSLKSIQQLLSDKHRTALQSGLDIVDTKHAELMGILDQKERRNVILKEEQSEIEKGQIAERQKQIEEEKEKLKLTAAEWEKKMKKYQEEFQKTIGDLEKQYASLEQSRRSLSSSLSSAEAELTNLEIRKSNFRDSDGNPVQFSSDPAFTSLLRRINEVSQRVSKLRQQYNGVMLNMQRVSAQGAQATNVFKQVVVEYQNATGNLLKQDKSLGKQFNKLAKKEEQLQTEKPNGETTETRNLRRKARLLSSYVDHEPKTEGERLVLAHFPE